MCTVCDGSRSVRYSATSAVVRRAVVSGYCVHLEWFVVSVLPFDPFSIHVKDPFMVLTEACLSCAFCFLAALLCFCSIGCCPATIAFAMLRR